MPDFNNHDDPRFSRPDLVEDSVRNWDDPPAGNDRRSSFNSNGGRGYPVPPPVSTRVSPPNPDSMVGGHHQTIDRLRSRFGDRVGFLVKNKVANILSEGNATTAKIETNFRKHALLLVREGQLQAFQITVDSWLQMGAEQNHQQVSQFLLGQKLSFQHELQIRQEQFNAYMDRCEDYARTIRNPRLRARYEMECDRTIDEFFEITDILKQKHLDIIRQGLESFSRRSFSLE